jgi:predicted ArsR family transcriptional regulator
MPGGTAIADDIKRFILTSIPSVPFLEAMLLLRNDAAVPWDAARLAQRLYLSEKAAAELLQQLHETHIVSADEQANSSYRYSPSSDALQHMIDRLAETYAAHLVDVTHLIHSKTGKKAQHFADAFIWRKDS